MQAQEVLAAVLHAATIVVSRTVATAAILVDCCFFDARHFLLLHKHGLGASIPPENDVTVFGGTEQLPLPTPLNPSAFSFGLFSAPRHSDSLSAHLGTVSRPPSFCTLGAEDFQPLEFGDEFA